MRLPTTSLRLASTLLVTLALACTGDDSGTSASSATSSASATAPTSSDGSSTTASTQSGSSTGASGSASEASASASSTTTAPTTSGETDISGSTTAASSSSTTTSTSSTSSGSSTGDPTGGTGELCDDVSEYDFGDCATPLGWIFDGEGCVPLSGCDCGSKCDAVFIKADECANTCAAAGECEEELLVGKGIAMGPYGIGDACDELTICGDTSMSVADLLPGAVCFDGGDYPCDEDGGCTLNTMDPITEEQLEKLCAASLLPGVDLVACVVYGP